MYITAWPTENLFFKDGVNEFAKTVNKNAIINYKKIVFIDFSKRNIKDVLSGYFLCVLPEDATFIFYCDDNTLPIGLYYLFRIKKTFVFTKKDSLQDILNSLIYNKINGSNREEKEFHGALTINEFIILKKIIVEHLDIKNIAKEQGVNIKTIYSRYYMALRKVKIKKLMKLYTD